MFNERTSCIYSRDMFPNMGTISLIIFYFIQYSLDL